VGDTPAAASATSAWRQAMAATRDWHAVFSAVPAASIMSLCQAAARYDVLMHRLNATNDDCAGIEAQAAALAVPDAARQVYDRAYRYIWKDDFTRAENLFRLLIQSENADGFTRGNSHYWLGFIARRIHGNPAAALPHYLQVHTYPACLVFIDAAVMEAAEIYQERGCYDTALALLAQQIPSIDFWKNEHLKAARSFHIAQDRRDATNVVRQLLRMAASTQHLAYVAADLEARRSWLAEWLPAAQFDAIAAHIEALEPFPIYQAEIISRALAGPEQGSKDPDLTDMLLHEWPSLDTVALETPIVMTNRPLSNNVFPQQRRDDVRLQTTGLDGR
jgi:hypothetical protein